MTIADSYYKNVPEYYPSMYMDGYSAQETYYAARKKMIKDIEAREQAKKEQTEAKDIPEVKITSEVKIK